MAHELAMTWLMWPFWTGSCVPEPRWVQTGCDRLAHSICRVLICMKSTATAPCLSKVLSSTEQPIFTANRLNTNLEHKWREAKKYNRAGVNEVDRPSTLTRWLWAILEISEFSQMSWGARIENMSIYLKELLLPTHPKDNSMLSSKWPRLVGFLGRKIAYSSPERVILKPLGSMAEWQSGAKINTVERAARDSLSLSTMLKERKIPGWWNV